MEQRRGRQRVERGPVSDYVADNVARIRKSEALSQQELSARLAQLARPMAPSAISKIEGRERGVDVDDLVALALALGVNPSALLLPPTAGDDEVPITPVRSAPAWAAWQWTNGIAPLPTRSAEDGYNSLHEIESFDQLARPMEFRVAARHPLVRAANEASRSAGHVLRQVMGLPGNPRPDASLPSLLKLARRAVNRLSSELDAVEDEQGVSHHG